MRRRGVGGALLRVRAALVAPLGQRALEGLGGVGVVVLAVALQRAQRRLGRAEDALQSAAAAAEALKRVRLLLARVEEADARERVVRVSQVAVRVALRVQLAV